MPKTRAFTLIELLIVVAIIAILAAIAVPNFLEAQTRSRVSRTQADMRSAATAIEAYQIDHNAYPFDGFNRADTARYNYWYLPIDISTPIAYLTTANLTDPFRDHRRGEGHWQFDNVRYRNTEATWGTAFAPFRSDNPTSPSTYHGHMLQDTGRWSLVSVGPDGYYGPSASSSTNLYPGGAESWPTPSGYPDHPQPYDPTNGTMSWGVIIRSQLSPTGYVNTN